MINLQSATYSLALIGGYIGEVDEGNPTSVLVHDALAVVEKALSDAAAENQDLNTRVNAIKAALA